MEKSVKGIVIKSENTRTSTTLYEYRGIMLLRNVV